MFETIPDMSPHHPRFFGRRRQAALAHRADLHAHLTQLDGHLTRLHAERRAVVERLVGLRDRLWPPSRGRVRRVPAVDELPMPPIPADAQRLCGRDLRTTCLVLVSRHGSLRLRELHALIHRHGYRVDSERPVQALSDALRYETNAGRATRVQRGVYELSPAGHAALRRWTAPPIGSPLPWTDGVARRLPPDPDLRADPDRWTPTPWPDHSVELLADDDDAVVAGRALLDQTMATRRRVHELIATTSADRSVPTADADRPDQGDPAERPNLPQRPGRHPHVSDRRAHFDHPT